jgi:RNA polymerase sigma factor (sigma-70 family)
MMDPDPSFAELLIRLRQGDQEAAARIFHTFSRRLIALARSRMHGLIRQKEDPEDISDSVFKSFFRRDAQEPFDLDDWDSLWSLLTVITLHKCGKRIRYFRAACRDVQREVEPPAEHNDSHAGWEVIAREPSPDEAVQLTDTVEQLMRELDGRERQILSLSLQGWTVTEVAAEVKRSERTVYRTLERIKDRLEDLGRDETPTV